MLSVWATCAALALGAALQEEVATVAAATMAFDGRLSPAWAWASCTLGTLAGDLAWFFGGRLARHAPLPPRWVLRWASPSRLQSTQAWLARRGWPLLVISRFWPGVRVAVQFGAGWAGFDTPRAIGGFLVGALAYNTLLFVAVWWAGAAAARAWPGHTRWFFLAALGAAGMWWITQRLLGRWLSRQVA